MSLPPTGGRGYRLGIGSTRRTGDSQFCPQFLSTPIKSFMVLALLRALIGANFSLTTRIWQLFYGFGPFTGTARDALTTCREFSAWAKNWIQCKKRKLGFEKKRSRPLRLLKILNWATAEVSRSMQMLRFSKALCLALQGMI
jgi:hypothetical protein